MHIWHICVFGLLLFFSSACSGVAYGGELGAQDSQRQCVRVDFTDKRVEIKHLNNMLTIATDSGMLHFYMKDKYDPYKMTKWSIGTYPLSLLSLDFDLTLTMTNLQVTGLSSIHPHPLKVLSSTSLGTGLDFGPIHAIADVRLEVEQKEKKWWKPCLTNMFSWRRCKPMKVDLAFEIGISNTSVDSSAMVEMKQCPPPPLPHMIIRFCQNLTIPHVLGAILTDRWKTLIQMITARIESFSIDQVNFSFDQLETLRLDFVSSKALTSQKLFQALKSKAETFSMSQINKKKDPIYQIVIDFINGFLKRQLNDIIKKQVMDPYGMNTFICHL